MHSTVEVSQKYQPAQMLTKEAAEAVTCALVSITVL